jgi:hypothetical protein
VGKKSGIRILKAAPQGTLVQQRRIKPDPALKADQAVGYVTTTAAYRSPLLQDGSR